MTTDSISRDSTVRGFVATIGLVAIFNVLRELEALFVPLVLALFLFFAFRPLNRRLARLRVPVGAAVIIDLLIVVAAVGGLVQAVAASFARLAAEWPRYVVVLDHFVATVARSWGGPAAGALTIASLAAKVDYGLFAGSLASRTFSVAGTAVFVLFFYVFVATGHETFLAKLRRRSAQYESQPGRTRLDQNVERITEEIATYLVMKSLINAGAGVACGLTLAFMGVEFAGVWGTCVWLFNYVPTLGALASAALPAAMALAQSGSPWYALMAAAVVLAVQTVAFSLVEPKLLGNRLGLNPLVILLALLLWGYTWGLAGMLLSVPLTAVMRIILSSQESETLRFAGELLGN
jgi:AI-2 transport protein TqsA